MACATPTYCILGAEHQCPEGTASATTSSVITDCKCIPGRWGPDGGTCRACAAGTSKTFQGCVSCQEVTATDCSACPLESASNDVGRGEACPVCATGHYEDVTGATACKTCPAGKYNTHTGMGALANCTLCPAGTYSATVGATDVSTCLACPLGKYCATAGMTAGVNCTAGTYSGTTCPLGKYCATAGMTAGVNCTAGTYSGTTGLSACLQCPAQTYMASTGATVCTACADGSFSDVGEPFCKVLTCAANSAGAIMVILAPNVSVRITTDSRLDSML